MEKTGKCIAIAGVGHWGRNILRNLYDLGVLHTACDIDPRALEGHKALRGEVVFTSSLDDLLEDPGIRAVCLATPAVTHYPLAKKVLSAGKDVFVEKPMAMNCVEGRELVDLAEREGRVLMVGHVLHYHPAVRRLSEFIGGGAIGNIQYIYSNRLNMGRLRADESILFSFAPHDISLILMLLGEEPSKISSFGGDCLNRDVYDTTLTSLTFPSGVKSHVFVSWLHPYKEQKLIVVGSRGMVVFDDLSEEKLFFYPHRVRWENGTNPVAQKREYEVVPVDKAEPLRSELEHFIDCVGSRRKPLTSGEEALMVLKVIEGAEKSLGRAKISHAARLLPGEEPYFVHESSYIDDNVKIGEGTRIWHFTHILKDTEIGRECVIGQNASIGPGVRIGSRCKIQNNVSIFRGVTLEDEVFCGPSCVFTNVYNPRSFIERKKEFADTLVKRGATVGANATVVCGVSVGRYAMIGAGAVVKDDVPDHAIVVGVPARRIGWACRCGVTLVLHETLGDCPSCGMRYRLGSGDSIHALRGNA